MLSLDPQALPDLQLPQFIKDAFPGSLPNLPLPKCIVVNLYPNVIDAALKAPSKVFVMEAANKSVTLSAFKQVLAISGNIVLPKGIDVDNEVDIYIFHPYDLTTCKVYVVYDPSLIRENDCIIMTVRYVHVLKSYITIIHLQTTVEPATARASGVCYFGC
jgi:hypothetical protein